MGDKRRTLHTWRCFADPADGPQSACATFLPLSSYLPWDGIPEYLLAARNGHPCSSSSPRLAFHLFSKSTCQICSQPRILPSASSHATINSHLRKSLPANRLHDHVSPQDSFVYCSKRYTDILQASLAKLSLHIWIGMLAIQFSFPDSRITDLPTTHPSGASSHSMLQFCCRKLL